MEKVNKKDREIRNNFALRFRVLMAYYDVTLQDLSKALNYPISTIGTWRNGRIPSSYDAVEQIATYFKVTPEFLLVGRVRCTDDKKATMEVVNQIKILLDELDDHTVIREMLRVDSTVEEVQQVLAQPTISPAPSLY